MSQSQPSYHAIHVQISEFGIARVTAAKALRQVAADGYAELSPGMGYYVKSR